MADEKDPKAPAEAAPEAGKPAEDAGKKKKKGDGKKKGLPVLKPREKLIFRVFIFMIVLLIVDAAMIHPINNYLRQLDESIKIKEETVPKRLLILKYKTRILNEYRALKSFFVETAITQEEETAQFLREIERVSKEENLFVSNINPVKIEKKSDTVYELLLDVEAKGGLKEIRSFMKALESTNPAIRVGSMNIKPQTKEANELKVLFSIVKM